jgi:hypothetical protein
MTVSSTLLARNPPAAQAIARGGTLARRSALPWPVRYTNLHQKTLGIRRMSVKGSPQGTTAGPGQRRDHPDGKLTGLPSPAHGSKLSLPTQSSFG